MYRYSLRKNFIIFQSIAIFLAIAPSPVKAQLPTNFVDLNQSRQFFERGQKQFEREINNFSQVFKLPKISLPADYSPENKIKHDIIQGENRKIKSISNLASDRYYIYSVVKL